ncbi:MAG: hypothetical protein FWD57_06600 [Polyangiaceae bacterium]|nr:hypothetical protein [Polyangiaceae bacterium]
MNSWSRITWIGGLALGVACSGSDDAGLLVRNADLQAGLAAQVGSESISVEQVLTLSDAEQIPAEEARSRLVYDALFAAEARAFGLADRTDVVGMARAELTRTLISRMKSDAYGSPITDEELARHTALNWLDMDRPEARRTVHAVVIPNNPDDPLDWSTAGRVARRIEDAVRLESSSEQFKKAAEAVDGDGLKVVVQDLPPVTSDGRVADLANRPPVGAVVPTFDLSFARAVFELGEVGDKKGGVRSQFGIHVVMLVSVQESRVVDGETRLGMLSAEIRAARMRGSLDGLLSTLVTRTPPKVERSVDAMLDLVSGGMSGDSGQVH